MRLGKLRGATSKDAMPIGPFRTSTQPVNLRDLDRFEAGDEVTPETLVEKRLIKNTRTDVKLLGVGEVTKKLTVRVHAISASAREKIEGAGGTVELLREPKVKKVRHRKAKPVAAEEPEAAAEEQTDAEATAAEEQPAPRRRKRPKGRRTRCSAWLANAWRVPELRRRLLFTAGVLAVYRLGSWVPAPGVDQAAIQQFFSSGGGSTGALSLLNLFSGSALSRFSLFALGIMPYVTASIIFQVLGGGHPVPRAPAEGGRGRLRQDHAVHALPRPSRSRRRSRRATRSSSSTQQVLTNVNSRPADHHHRHAHRRHRAPHVDGRADHEARHRQRHLAPDLRLDPRLRTVRDQRLAQRRNSGRLFFPIIALAIVVSVVFVMEGQRRIPVQYARRQLGNRQTTGGSTYMPLSVVMAGVIPIIFAAAVLAVPQTVGSFKVAWSNWITQNFNYTSWKYLLVEAILIMLMTYFYTSVVFNPVEQADNLRKYNGYIPGIRPGPPTAAYFDRVLNRLTFPGALFLAAVAVAPSVFIQQFHFNQATYRALGGTSVLIVVGVALQTMRQMESQMVMRHYEGFLR